MRGPQIYYAFSDARLPAIDVRPLVGRLGRGRGPPGDGHGPARQERSTSRDRSHFGLQTDAIGRNWQRDLIGKVPASVETTPSGLQGRGLHAFPRPTSR